VIDNKLSLVLLQKITDNFAIVEIIGNFLEIARKLLFQIP